MTRTSIIWLTTRPGKEGEKRKEGDDGERDTQPPKARCAFHPSVEAAVTVYLSTVPHHGKKARNRDN